MQQREYATCHQWTYLQRKNLAHYEKNTQMLGDISRHHQDHGAGWRCLWLSDVVLFVAFQKLQLIRWGLEPWRFHQGALYHWVQRPSIRHALPWCCLGALGIWFLLFGITYLLVPPIWVFEPDATVDDNCSSLKIPSIVPCSRASNIF